MVYASALPYLLPVVLLAGCAQHTALHQPQQFAYQQVAPAAGQGAEVRTDAPMAYTGQTPILTPGRILLVRTQAAPEPEIAAPQPTAEDLKALVRQQAEATATQVAYQIAELTAAKTSAQTLQQAQQIAEQAKRIAQTEAQAAAENAKIEAQTIAQQAKLEAQAIAAQAKLEAQTIAEQAKRAAQAETAQTNAKFTTQLTEKFAAKYDQLATRTDNLLSQTSAVLAANTTTQQAVTAQLNASSQLGESVKAATTTKLSEIAKTTEQKLTQLEQSKLKPEEIQTIATQAATAAASKTATEVATQVATQTATAATQNATAAATQAATQVAENTVANAVPQFRALALQGVKDSESYIRTIARNTVQNEADPAIQNAMANAARNVIVKDDKVVFAIRQAVTDGLVQAGLTSPTTRLGDISPAAGGNGVYPSIITAAQTANGQLDPTRLGVAPLLPPTGITQKGDNPNLATLSPAAGRATSLTPPRTRTGTLNLREYRVVIHDDNRTLEQLLSGVLQKAEPYTGPWQIKWKVSDENKEILTEKFSLDVETTFEDFANYLAQYMVNERGVKLSFNLFDSERIIVVSD